MRDRRIPGAATSILVVPILLLAFLVAAAPSGATAIYGYTGAVLSGPLHDGKRVQGFVLFEDPLPSDMPFQDVKSLVTHHYFRDGVNFFLPSGGLYSFSVGTNSAGDIIEWDFSMSSFDNSGCAISGPCALLSRGSPTGGSDFVQMLDGSFPAFDASSSSPGTWLTGVPEPSTALLGLAGLASLGAIRRWARSEVG